SRRLNDWKNRDEHPIPPLPSTLDSYVLIRRDELAALRDAAADVRKLEAELAASDTSGTSDSGTAEPDVVEPTEVIPARPVPSAAERRHRSFFPHDAGIGLIGTAATGHTTGRYPRHRGAVQCLPQRAAAGRSR